MLEYNLRNVDKIHPDDYKYGIITGDSVYRGYPITIVDNHKEVEHGKYTGAPSLCLMHLAEGVRQPVQLVCTRNFSYLDHGSIKRQQYRMFDYSFKTVCDETAVALLRRVVYLHQPNLQSRSLVGSSSKKLEDDPNYYTGKFVLDNEELYTVLKCKTTFKIFRGAKSYYPDWNTTEDLLWTEEITFDIYEESIELTEMRSLLVYHANEYLDNDCGSEFLHYLNKKKEVEKKVEEFLSN